MAQPFETYFQDSVKRADETFKTLKINLSDITNKKNHLIFRNGKWRIPAKCGTSDF